MPDVLPAAQRLMAGLQLEPEQASQLLADIILQIKGYTQAVGGALGAAEVKDLLVKLEVLTAQPCPRWVSQLP